VTPASVAGAGAPSTAKLAGERYTPTLFPGPPSIPTRERSFPPRSFATYLKLLWECFEHP
jgi:hypothetical protein